MPVFAHNVSLGSRVPWFRAESADGAMLSPHSAENQPLLVMFLCNHSPYVRHIEHHLGRLIAEYQERGLFAIAASPNDPISYPIDDAKHTRDQIRRAGFTFPYIIDGDQVMARVFGASCTPEFFLYSDMEKGGRLTYHGEYDETRPGHGVEPTGAPLRAAMDAALNNSTYRHEQQPSFGCSVKWRSGLDATVALVAS